MNANAANIDLTDMTKMMIVNIQNVGVICPHCGISHRLGDIKITSTYNLLEGHEDVEKQIISPNLEAILPINPATYTGVNKSKGFVVHCYNCKTPMMMIPDHLNEMSAAFNSYSMFNAGNYFRFNPETGKVSITPRELRFIDINFILTALLDRVEMENISLDPVPDAPVDAQGIPRTWVFDVSATKDQSFKDLGCVQIVRSPWGNRGFIGHLDPLEKFNQKDAKMTTDFMDAMVLILDLVSDWREHREEIFTEVSSDPFREFYRKEYQRLLDENYTLKKSLDWLIEGHELKYPAMQ